tara:strand:- start:7283 stop:7648 length:366 start_codon:yes stop_codon:yes gene_type:complete
MTSYFISQLEETGLSQEIRKAAESLGANAMVVLMDYAEEMSGGWISVFSIPSSRCGFIPSVRCGLQSPLYPLLPCDWSYDLITCTDLESVIAAEEKERHAAFDRKLKASTEVDFRLSLSLS